jgi:hypothetical protein
VKNDDEGGRMSDPSDEPRRALYEANGVVMLERLMPRDWLTPDLRLMVAEWVVSMVSKEPWNLTDRDGRSAGV